MSKDSLDASVVLRRAKFTAIHLLAASLVGFLFAPGLFWIVLKNKPPEVELHREPLVFFDAERVRVSDPVPGGYLSYEIDYWVNYRGCSADFTVVHEFTTEYGTYQVPQFSHKGSFNVSEVGEATVKRMVHIPSDALPGTPFIRRVVGEWWCFDPVQWWPFTIHYPPIQVTLAEPE